DQAYTQQQQGYAASPQQVFDQFARQDPTHQIQHTLETLPAPAPASKTARYVVMVLLLLTVGLALYAVPRFAAAGTGSLEVESNGDPDALVRVDGIVRGNPPLVVEGLTPGIHKVEIEAPGFEVARADVHVEKGQARAISLTLEKSARAGDKPVAAPAANAAGEAAPAPQITELPPAPADKPKERKHLRRAVPEESDSIATADALNKGDPAVEEGNSSETQVAEEVNVELAATNEGELLISTVPWSHVLVDGQDTGRDTPVRALRVPAGKHKVGLRTPDDVLHEVDVDVKAGQVVRIIRRF
ncbi:MAG TPA: PEGA domain-containing protein, partial [Polyangiales bacterium]|nr:PEGA domain-containing protein [Polyangiales bacterium]